MADETLAPEFICMSCEKPTADEALDDDGYCAECAFEADIRRAENMRDAREDR